MLAVFHQMISNNTWRRLLATLRRHSVIDQSTGRVDMRYNPMSIEEDYFIPVRPGSATEVTNLAGGQNTAAVEDVKYLRDKVVRSY